MNIPASDMPAMKAPEWVHAVDPCEAGCPSRDLLDLIGDRWSMLIMLVIGQGITRNGALKRRIGGISQKMLTQTLRALEANGLVERHDFATVPPHVEYALTPLGVSLQHALSPLFGWVEAHFDAVLRARTAFAGRTEAAA
jgi:DNA-binding HxlR family transcriptional regulator